MAYIVWIVMYRVDLSSLWCSSEDSCDEEEDDEEEEEEEEEEEGEGERSMLQLSGCEGFVWEREDKGRGEEERDEMESDEEPDNVGKEVVCMCVCVQ